VIAFVTRIVSTLALVAAVLWVALPAAVHADQASSSKFSQINGEHDAAYTSLDSRPAVRFRSGRARLAALL